jgi:hypothetical protein
LNCRGALVIECFNTFPDFALAGEFEFYGEWKDKVKYDARIQPNVVHSLLVVGATLTPSEGDKGGMMLLVQNSSQETPFAIVGYDLLRSMGVDHLLSVTAGLNFETKANNINGNLNAIGSGHMSPDKVGLLCGLDKLFADNRWIFGNKVSKKDDGEIALAAANMKRNFTFVKDPKSTTMFT